MATHEWIKTSAPGKIILHGEHAVVYGSRAIAASLDLRCFVEITNNTTSDNQVQFQAADLDINTSWDITDLERIIEDVQHRNSTKQEDIAAHMKECINMYLEGCEDSDSLHIQSCKTFLTCYMLSSYLYNRFKLPSISVKVKSNIPLSSGMGSSASFAVSLSAALLTWVNAIPHHSPWHDWHLKIINNMSYELEKIIHGRPSGVDNTVCCYGKIVSFKSGEFEFLEAVPKLELLATNTKVPRSTKQLVSKVKILKEKYPAIIDPIMLSIDAISSESKSILYSKGNISDKYSEIGKLVEMNQYLLEALGVSSKYIDDVRNIIHEECSLPSKLTGAGYGGVVITFLPPSTSNQSIKAATKRLEESGYQCFKTSLCVEGVKLHKDKDLGLR